MVSLLRRGCAPRARRRRCVRPGLEAVESRLVPATLASSAAIAVPMIEPMPVSAWTVAGMPAPVHPAAWSQATPWGLAPQQLAAADGFTSR
ncbi:MAG: hypothetical protein ACYC61_27005, partial [Isosphaeraceae bacterium]